MKTSGFVENALFKKHSWQRGQLPLLMAAEPTPRILLKTFTWGGDGTKGIREDALMTRNTEKAVRAHRPAVDG